MPEQKTLETTVDGLREAVLGAGFKPGRRVRVSIDYVTADPSLEMPDDSVAEVLRLYPLPPEAEGKSDAEIMDIADRVVREVRVR